MTKENELMPVVLRYTDCFGHSNQCLYCKNVLVMYGGRHLNRGFMFCLNNNLPLESFELGFVCEAYL